MENNKKIFLWIVIALIAGFLIWTIINRLRLGNGNIYNIFGTGTTNATGTGTGTITATTTSTGTATSSNSAERTAGCVPLGNYNGAVGCPPNKVKKLVNETWMCC